MYYCESCGGFFVGEGKLKTVAVAMVVETMPDGKRVLHKGIPTRQAVMCEKCAVGFDGLGSVSITGFFEVEIGDQVNILKSSEDLQKKKSRRA